MPSFSKSSEEKLKTCEKPLQDLFNEVICYTDCTVVCGHRGQEEQNTAFEAGFSKVKYPNSKHNSFPSKAVDVVPYPIDWYDVERFQAFAKLVKEVAAKLGVSVEWGGDWKDFPDYPHWQIRKITNERNKDEVA